MITILNDYYSDAVLSDTHVYSESGVYKQLESDNDHRVSEASSGRTTRESHNRTRLLQHFRGFIMSASGATLHSVVPGQHHETTVAEVIEDKCVRSISQQTSL